MSELGLPGPVILGVELEIIGCVIGHNVPRRALIGGDSSGSGRQLRQAPAYTCLEPRASVFLRTFIRCVNFKEAEPAVDIGVRATLHF
jgi:hypothetical protein